jgi:hypothetical protein
MVKIKGPSSANGRHFRSKKFLVVVQLLCVSIIFIYVFSSIKSIRNDLVIVEEGTVKETPTTEEDVKVTANMGENEKITIDQSATVIGIATGYFFDVYQSFVGSLRKTGYKGHIILGVSPDIQPYIEEYLTKRKVTIKKIHSTECSPSVTAPEGCADPYPNIKIRWARFPLARDWLQECSTCTGPVLITDVRDAYFQDNPFGEGGPVVDSLQVFEENPTQTTQHWLVEWPVRECRGVTYDKPMLCSGSTIGTRDTMLQYLEKMYDEMKAWTADPKCHFDINGDDQSIHNYLFYSGQLPFAEAIPPRTGIVNTVGVDGSNVFEKGHMLKWTNQGKSRGEARDMLFDGANGDNWLGNLNKVSYRLIDNVGYYVTADGSKYPLEYNWTSEVRSISYDLIDKEGYFVNADGSRSRMIHQFDRFGPPLEGHWLWAQPFMQDILDSS